MRIRGWQVDGFGIFRDYALTDLPAGLVLLHGPNEAGKTTLLAFLRGVLFGFADRRRLELFYPPLRGGRHGGAISLEGQDGVYRVERTAGRRVPPVVVRPDGSEGDAMDLARLLGGADDTLFNSVFAFSLHELTDMASLSSEEVRARIFSAGIAGAGRSARDVIDDVQSEAGGLLTTRGGRIRELMAEVQALRTRIDGLASAAAEYPAMVGRERTARVEMERLRMSTVESRAAVARLNKLIDLWPTELELQEKRQALDALPAVTPFPEEAEVRLAGAITAREGTRSAWTSAEQHLNALLEQRKAISLDPRLEAASAEAESLAREAAVQRERLDRLTSQRQAFAEADAAAANAIAELGPAWDDDRLRSFDISLPAAEEVRALEQELDAAREAAGEAKAALEALDANIGSLENDLDQLGLETGTPGSDVSPEQIEQVAARLDAIGARIVSVAGVEPIAVSVHKRLADAIAELRRAERDHLQLNSTLDHRLAELDRLRPDPSLDPVHPVIADVARQMDVQHHRLSDLRLRAREAGDSQAALERIITALGFGWDETRARALPCDFARVQQIRQFGDDIQKARAAVQDGEKDVEGLRRGISARQKDLERLRAMLAGPEPSGPDELTGHATAIRRLRVNLTDLADLRSRLRDAEASRRESPGEINGRPPLAAAFPPWLTPVAMALALLSGAGAVWRLASGDPAGSAVLLVLGLVLALGGAAIHRLHARAGAQARTSATGLATGLPDLDQRLAKLAAEETQLLARIAEDAAVLGLRPLPLATDVEERDEQRERQRDDRRAWDDTAAQASGLERELDSWYESESARKQTLDACVAQEAQVGAEWLDWKHDAGLPAELSPSAVADFLQQVREVQQRLHEFDRLGEELERLRSNAHAWEARARVVLGSRLPGTVTSATGFDLIEAIGAVQRECQADANLRRDRTRVEEQVAELQRQCATTAIRVTEARTAATRAASNDVEHLKNAWRRTAAARDHRRLTLTIRAAQMARADAAWRGWQDGHGIDRSLSPDGVLDFFSLVRRAREAVRTREAILASAEELDGIARRWRSRAEGVVIASGVGLAPDASVEDVLQGVRDLSSRCADDKVARQDATRLEKAIEGSTSTLDHARLQYSQADAALSGVLGEAGAPDEQHYRAGLSVFRARTGLQREIDDLQTRITATVGRGEDADRLRAELSEGLVGEWQVDRARHTAEVSRMEEQLEQSIRVHQDLSNTCRHLENTADVAGLELDYQAVLADLNASMERWHLLRLTRGLVQQTLGEYERTRQPEVLAAASRIFARVTSGRFERVVQHEGGGHVAIIDQTGARRDVTELSRGTREQLYLCIRLGLAEEFGRRAEPLPLVMDDVLVNFDTGRARAMAAELLRFAERHQVLLFTCHSFTRDLMVELDPRVRVIELARLDLPAAPRGQSHGAILPS